MEFNLEVPENQFFIRSVSEKGIRVNQDYFNRPIIISGQRIVPQWDVASVEDINEESLQAVFDLEPEVILIGTGNKQIFFTASRPGSLLPPQFWF
ncbi:MAG TPA: MTH938/NDUFAF3 family protein [Xanthomonadales bacterium]